MVCGWLLRFFYAKHTIFNRIGIHITLLIPPEKVKMPERRRGFGAIAEIKRTSKTESLRSPAGLRGIISIISNKKCEKVTGDRI
jgi:hypothetical protein